MLNTIFESENEKLARQSKLRGLMITMLIHGIILLVLAFILSLEKPWPPLPESGVMLNYGTSDLGMGDVQPMGDESMVEMSSVQPEQSASGDKIITNDKSTSSIFTPLINTNPTNNSSTSTNTSTTTSPPTPPKPKHVYGGANGKPNNSSGQGPDGVPGDKGKTNGTPGGTSYSGDPGFNGGNGSGVSGLNLAGRKITKYPTINDNSQKKGKVAVKIKVDKSGHVISAVFTNSGSTTTDSYLVNLAVKAAGETIFNPSEAIEQIGTITFSFRVK